jgi:hypothetical protein
MICDGWIPPLFFVSVIALRVKLITPDFTHPAVVTVPYGSPSLGQFLGDHENSTHCKIGTPRNMMGIYTNFTIIHLYQIYLLDCNRKTRLWRETFYISHGISGRAPVIYAMLPNDNG